jgi:nucleotide-binding universal stress UspA family protein
VLGSKTMLVAIEFDDASSNAIAVACSLAPDLGLEIVLLHVVPPGPIAQTAQSALAKVAEAHGGLRSLLRAGDPAMEILKVIEELEPMLVAIGTRKRAGLGSVVAKVVGMSPTPVLTVHAKEPS